MSKSREEDSIPVPRDFIEPRVLVGVGGKNKELLCDYTNVDFIFSDDLNISPTQMFNTFGNKKNYDLFLFMNDSFSFSKKESLSMLVNSIWKEDFVRIGGMYSDINVLIDDIYLPIKYNYSFDSKLFYSKVLMNIPFIVKSSICPKFNEDLEEIYLYEGLLSLVKRSFMFHCPHCLFNLETFDKMNPKIAQEIEIINGIEQ